MQFPVITQEGSLFPAWDASHNSLINNAFCNYKHVDFQMSLFLSCLHLFCLWSWFDALMANSERTIPDICEEFKMSFAGNFL